MDKLIGDLIMLAGLICVGVTAANGDYGYTIFCGVALLFMFCSVNHNL